MANPTYRDAIEAGIIDRTRRMGEFGVVQSFSGNVTFEFNGRTYKAIGYPPVVDKGTVVTNGYIDIVALPRNVQVKKESGIAGWFRQLVA